MIDDREYFLLTLNVINLLQLNDGTLFEALQSQRLRIIWLTSMLDESHSTKSARAQRRQDVEIIQEQNAFLFALGSILLLLRRLLVMNYIVNKI